MGKLIGSRPLVLTESQSDSIQLLKKELRNRMEHYVPSGWSIEIHGLPQMAIDALDVIHFLAVDTHSYVRLTQTQIRRTKSCVFQSKKFLKSTMLYQEALHATTLL
jgi:hypothetical protein